MDASLEPAPDQQSAPNELLSAAARELLNAALDVLQGDPHQWSTRPCQTCRAVSAIAKRPFGCELLRKQVGR